MAILKCKMCGGDMEISADETYGICEYCGSTMTLPKVDDDQRAAVFNRGNYFRRIGEFDKALAVYEQIVQEDENDAEAHWCCALCRYGIEYVEDPTSKEWHPTCHRVSYDNFLEDIDYQAAVEHSEGVTKEQYQKDGAKIAEVQRGILVTSQSEKPYDIFICYKETNENGERTRDSVFAQEIYYQLTEQNRRVFFARITLEDIVGRQYEPYIFAALHSAKVMVVVGTKPEYLNAVWVKNEWSRFLTMMKHDRNKILLPCYRDMEPYDLPEQLSVLQAYDMGRIGFIQDLTRGISKVLDVEKELLNKTSFQSSPNINNTAALLDRAYMALEDHEWEKADAFFEEILNQDARCAKVYMGKVLIEEKCSDISSFISKRTHMSAESVSCVAELPKDDQHIEEAVRKYEVPGCVEAEKIRALYQFDLHYAVEANSWKKKLKAEERYWNNNNNLSRAIKFASGETAKEYARVKKTIFDFIKQRAADAEIEDQKRVSDLQKRYADHLTQADIQAERVFHQAAAEEIERYTQLCSILENSEKIKELQAAAAGFVELKNFRESEQKSRECTSKIKRIQEEKENRERRIAEAKKQEKIDRIQRKTDEQKKINEEFALSHGKTCKKLMWITHVVALCVGIVSALLISKEIGVAAGIFASTTIVLPLWLCLFLELRTMPKSVKKGKRIATIATVIFCVSALFWGIGIFAIFTEQGEKALYTICFFAFSVFSIVISKLGRCGK